jgi:VanZ family protein
MNSSLIQEFMAYLFTLSVILIAVGCLVPSHWLPPMPNDKYLHFIAYALLSVFAMFLTTTFFEFLAWQSGLLLIGILIEGLQHFTPGRHFCWRDILANTAGICFVGVGATFYYL